MSVFLSVSPSASNISAPTGRIGMKFNIWVFFQNLSRTFKFYKNLTRITGIVHKDLCSFMIMSRWILFRIRNFTNFVENSKHTFCVQYFFSPKRWKGEKYGIARLAVEDNVIQSVCISCWKLKEEYKHTLRTCNTESFSTANIVARRRLFISLYLHCLTCKTIESVPVRHNVGICYYVSKEISWTLNYKSDCKKYITYRLLYG